MKKFDEPHESAGAALLDIDRDETIKVDHGKKRDCPKCDQIVMMRHFFSVKKDVGIDECGSCGGIWLDVGELGRIRSLFKTEEEREKAAEEYFDIVFGNELDTIQAKSAEFRGKAGKFANLFRFICPSNYISGNPKGGAF